MVCQCNDCGLIQLKNNPVGYYKNVITAASLSESSKDNLVNEWRPFVKKYNVEGKDAIEVGAGRGDFLQVLEKLNINTYGIENSAENIKECNKKNLNVDKTSLNEAADRFEALFLAQMLKSARAAKLSEDIMGNNASDTYYAMMDNELAEKLSQAGNFGIAEALIRQFGGNVEDKNK